MLPNYQNYRHLEEIVINSYFTNFIGVLEIIVKFGFWLQTTA